MQVVEIAQEVLTTRQMQVWKLRRIDGLSTRQVSVDLDIAENTVKWHLWAAEERLADNITEEDLEVERTRIASKYGNEEGLANTPLQQALGRFKKRVLAEKRGAPKVNA